MNVNQILGVNPFIEAYIQSDLLGKLIFISLLLLSICCWTILSFKTWQTRQAKKNSFLFQKTFSAYKANPLGVESDRKKVSPFLHLYGVLKKQTLDILSKNRRFGSSETVYLSSADINLVESQLSSAIALQIKDLEKNLYLLSTIVSLAPFLGLLGTVWGILTTFASLQLHTGSAQMMGGLSLALATTVLGLVDAIPALIGYNYLKNSVRSFETDMEGFSMEIVSSIEMQYRKVDPTL